MPRFLAPDGVTTIPVSADDPLPVTFEGGEGPAEEVAVTSLPTAVRVEGITRYNSAGTRTVGAGKRSYSVLVVAAASAASPTLGGVALPAGWSGEFTAPVNDTLTGLSLVTVGVDDVIVTAI